MNIIFYCSTELLELWVAAPLLFIETLLNTGNKPPKIQISKWKINKDITQKIKNRNNFESRKLKHHHLSFPVLYALLLLSSSFAQHEIIWSSFTELEQALPTGRWHIHVPFHVVHLRKTSAGYKIKHNKLLKFFEYETSLYLIV